MPPGGWQEPPEPVKRFIESLSAPRRELLLTRGLLDVRVAAPPAPAGDTLIWLHGDPADLPADVTYFIDGSLYEGGREFGRRTGFGVVAVSAEGDLLAYGCGVPPAWVRDVAGAEAWAFVAILRVSPDVPRTTTDCMGVVKAIAAGATRLTAAACPLARLWRQVFGILADMGRDPADVHCLRWMPSHTSPGSIGHVLTSDGTLLTPLEWRANRLADWLAKSAAEPLRVPRAARRFIDVAAQALEYGLRRLGAVTHAANNLRVQVTLPNGDVTTVTRRDAAAMRPTGHRGATPVRRRSAAGAPPTEGMPAEAARAVHSGRCSAERRRSELDHAAEVELRFQEAWRARRAALRPSSAPPAASRLAALRARVQARERMWGC